MMRNKKGFTLIELLIVIVIIGILAGVLIAVIDPAQQQSKARDAGVKAAMNKVALATEGYISAYGSAPTEVQFMANIKNRTKFGSTCDSVSGYDCLFSVNGNALPLTCGTNNWGGSGGSQCYFRYESSAGSKVFDLYAKSYGIVDTVFRYNNGWGEIRHCNVSGGDASGGGCVAPTP